MAFRFIVLTLVVVIALALQFAAVDRFTWPILGICVCSFALGWIGRSIPVLIDYQRSARRFEASLYALNRLFFH